jgi:ATP dependent DNA ligase-like protein
MPVSSSTIRPADLTPMPYGRANARSIRNGIWEPLWGGRRTLVDVLGSEVGIRDEAGDPLEGFDLLRAAIREAAKADELVLDGYLLPAPLQDTAGLDSVPGVESIPTATEMGRQFLVGGSGQTRRAEIDADLSRRVTLRSESPTAFVAIDLLWLDGEPLIDVPLAERKRLLEAVLVDGEIVRRTVAVREPVEAWYAQWRAFGFREVAVKGANSRYTPGTPHQEWATALIPRR